MLTVKEGIKAVKYVRMIIEEHIRKTPITHHDFESVFHEKRGAFVTLYTYPTQDLRGCIGIPQPVMPLKDALREAAVSSTHDPRFYPLIEKELDGIIVEITILTKPAYLELDFPEQYPEHIIIGKDGLIIEYLGRSGLLLPQVPVEYGWDGKTFLNHLCLKAGLPEDIWLEGNVNIYKFSGQIFSEKKPYGDIEEKIIDGI